MEAINQGKCVCGASDDNYTVRSKESGEHEDHGDYLNYQLTCVECGEKVAVYITENGLVTAGEISHDDASWNTEEDEE